MYHDDDPEKYRYALRVYGDSPRFADRRWGRADLWRKSIAKHPTNQEAYTHVGRWNTHTQPDMLSDQPVYVPWLVLDVDREHDLIEAWSVTRNLVENVASIGISLDEVLVGFSGNKGYHVQIPMPAFGAPVFEDSHAASFFLRALTREIAAGEKVDLAPASPINLIRVTGSWHRKSHMHKVVCSASYFQTLSRDTALNMGHMPYSKTLEDPHTRPDDIPSDVKDVVWAAHRQAKDAMTEQKAKRGHGIISRIESGVVEQDVFGPKHFHVGRGNAAYIIACWYIEQGTVQEARQNMQEWATKCDPPLPTRRWERQFEAALKKLNRKTR